MKRGIFILLVLSINLALASPNLAFNKQNISLGETLLGTLSGNFENDISASELLFYQGQKQVFLESDTAFYNGTYYFYILPVKEGTYTLKINNVLFRDPELKSANLERTFTVSKSNQSLSITPGMIVTSSGKSIAFSNKGSSPLNFSYVFEGNKSEVSLNPGSFVQVPIYPTKDFSIIKVESYDTFNIPIIFTRLTNTSYTYLDIGVVPSFLKVRLNQNQSMDKQIVLVNRNNFEVQVFASKNSSLYNVTALSIPSQEARELNLTFLSDSQGVFNDTLKITFNPQINALEIPIEIFVFAENYTLPEENDTSVPNSSREISCSELNGQICFSGQFCNGTASQALEGYCCIGNCYVPSSLGPAPHTGSYGWLYGLIIILILGVAGYFIYKKYKKTGPKSPDQAIKEKSRNYEKRIAGSLTRE
jgi:hypothetical protein